MLRTRSTRVARSVAQFSLDCQLLQTQQRSCKNQLARAIAMQNESQ